jgi:hypothetical protein
MMGQPFRNTQLIRPLGYTEQSLTVLNLPRNLQTATSSLVPVIVWCVLWRIETVIPPRVVDYI